MKRVLKVLCYGVVVFYTIFGFLSFHFADKAIGQEISRYVAERNEVDYLFMTIEHQDYMRKDACLVIKESRPDGWDYKAQREY
jgi:hypothetical protein